MFFSKMESKKRKKERQKTFRGSNINWPRRKFQTHSILARYFVICLLFIQWTYENSEKKLSNCPGMNFPCEWNNMHACYLCTAIDIVDNDFPLLKGTLIMNERLRLNSFIWGSAHSFHAPTFLNNQTYQPVHTCMHKTEWHRKKYLVIKLTNT